LLHLQTLLQVAQYRCARSDLVFYNVALPKALKKNEDAKVVVTVVLVNVLAPFPAEIAQDETQKVLFKGNHYVVSPYACDAQKTIIKLASDKVESFSKNLKPAEQSGKEVTYGVYENVAAYSASPMSVHFESNTPFLQTRSVVREIEVSHWGGNVAVTEHFDMTNAGALLKGGFSRFDFQRSQQASGVAAVKEFLATFPHAAADVYYRDVIGNISTSHLRQTDKNVEMEVRPRFPLFGGWNTQFTIGYNLPASSVLSVNSDDGTFVLKMPLAGSTYEDLCVSSLTLRVLLPEGAELIKFENPFGIQAETKAPFPTYLDTIGRTVVEAKATNVVSEHTADFTLTYQTTLSPLREPLMLVSGFAVLFAVAIVVGRLDFSLSSSAVVVDAQKKKQ
jgi:oligosaccharyltransferase complex subunit alpha (ribophorin I)